MLIPNFTKPRFKLRFIQNARGLTSYLKRVDEIGGLSTQVLPAYLQTETEALLEADNLSLITSSVKAASGSFTHSIVILLFPTKQHYISTLYILTIQQYSLLLDGSSKLLGSLLGTL